MSFEPFEPMNKPLSKFRSILYIIFRELALPTDKLNVSSSGFRLVFWDRQILQCLSVYVLSNCPWLGGWMDFDWLVPASFTSHPGRQSGHSTLGSAVSRLQGSKAMSWSQEAAKEVAVPKLQRLWYIYIIYILIYIYIFMTLIIY